MVLATTARHTDGDVDPSAAPAPPPRARDGIDTACVGAAAVALVAAVVHSPGAGTARPAAASDADCASATTDHKRGGAAASPAAPPCRPHHHGAAAASASGAGAGARAGAASAAGADGASDSDDDAAAAESEADPFPLIHELARRGVWCVYDPGPDGSVVVTVVERADTMARLNAAPWQHALRPGVELRFETPARARERDAQELAAVAAAAAARRAQSPKVSAAAAAVPAPACTYALPVTRSADEPVPRRAGAPAAAAAAAAAHDLSAGPKENSTAVRHVKQHRGTANAKSGLSCVIG